MLRCYHDNKMRFFVQVLSCKVSRLPGPERQSRGFAFIEFEHPDDASAAIKGLDKTMLGDRLVTPFDLSMLVKQSVQALILFCFREITVQRARRDKGYNKTPGIST